MPLRLFNALGLAGVSAVLLVAFFYQLAMGELPCPLCLLQRGAFVALGLGFLLNIYLGSSTAHYALVIVGAVAGAITSSRQILLHIGPGNTGYGSALLGLHFYSWALIAFVAFILYAAILLFIESFERSSGRGPLDRGSAAASWLFLILVAANLVSTVLECGVGPCADNPTSYIWLPG
jgi:disulfide bond formation protein DsbB